MKTNVQEQLRAYIEQCKHPDEQILAIEKKRVDGAENFLGIFVCVFMVAAFALLCVLAVWSPILWGTVAFVLLAITMAIGTTTLFLNLFLTTDYLVVSDRAVYYCSGFHATTVYVWTYGEIAFVECKREKILITSTHQGNDVGYAPVMKKSLFRKNLVLALSKKPLEYRQFPLTQLFAMPRSREAFIAKNLADLTHRLKFQFSICSDSVLRDAFIKAVKKNPPVKLECDGILVR